MRETPKNPSDNIQTWIDREQELLLQNKSAKKLAKNFGMALAPFSTAIVYPYAKDFGKTFVRTVLRSKNPFLMRYVPTYFAISGWISVSSIAAYVCGDVFSKLASHHENPASKLINRNYEQERTSDLLKITTAFFAGQISMLPSSYLTFQQFKPKFGRVGSGFLSLMSQVMLGAVSSWSLYYLPDNLLKIAENNVIPEKYLSERRKMLHELEIKLSHSSELNSGAKLASFVGLAIGISSSYFFYPLGKTAGGRLTAALKIPSRFRLPFIIASISFLCNALLASYATSQCMSAMAVSASSSLQFNGLDIFLLALALSSSAHRIAITKQFVNTKTVFGMSILGCTVFSLVCTNFWFTRSLLKGFLKEEYAKNDLETTLRAGMYQMDHHHLSVLYEDIHRNSFRLT